jgi:hypothetical protein
MRSIHTAIATVLFGATTVAATYGAALTSPVGDVEVVQERAYGTPPDAARAEKRRGDDIVYQEMLETLQKSAMQVKFNDGSKLTLGANSKVLVDAFVYEPGNAESKALISLPTGALRYVTGKMPKGQTTIDTPTATMVLRGTNVKVVSDSSGNTLLVVDEGSVSVHNKRTGEDTLVEEGHAVQISQTGNNATDQDDTGDSIVDDGFIRKSDNDNEHRRTDQHHDQGHTSTDRQGTGSTPG